MLVLTRKQGQTIQIANGITVKVIKTGKGTVKIGIDASSDIPVLRGELADKQRSLAGVSSGQASEHPPAVEFVGYFPYPQSA